MAKRLLLFAATTGYQIRVFAEAARRLGIDATLAEDRCNRLEDPWGDRSIAVKFDYRMPKSIETFRGMQFDGVAAVGDRPAILAADVAELLGIPFHPPAAARACQDKYLARQLYRTAGMLVPEYFRASLAEPPGPLARRAPYPCVLKPVGLSASRGVIRANDEQEFLAAFERIRALLEENPDLRRLRERYVQVESYIEGREFAIEGLVTYGRFQPFAIFDKPDPLEGPFFEETIYTTPSRAEPEAQRELLVTAANAIKALGLRHGPTHLELRYNGRGAWMLDAAARPIGGLCAKALTFEWDSHPGPTSLEEIILRHALGEDISAARTRGPSGVMMIPIPKAGIYESVEGIENATAVPGIEDVIITAKQGQRLVPLPEGSTYLGFIFARAESAEEVESALRRAHDQLRFRINYAFDLGGT